MFVLGIWQGSGWCRDLEECLFLSTMEELWYCRSQNLTASYGTSNLHRSRAKGIWPQRVLTHAAGLRSTLVGAKRVPLAHSAAKWIESMSSWLVARENKETDFQSGHTTVAVPSSK